MDFLHCDRPLLTSAEQTFQQSAADSKTYRSAIGAAERTKKKERQRAPMSSRTRALQQLAIKAYLRLVLAPFRRCCVAGLLLPFADGTLSHSPKPRLRPGHRS
jgi:hypothetical protein